MILHKKLSHFEREGDAWVVMKLQNTEFDIRVEFKRLIQNQCEHTWTADFEQDTDEFYGSDPTALCRHF